MDVLIPNSWLKDFLKTNASPKDIARFLSLSGPSIEKISKVKDDFVYHVEITTNRVDSVSIYGFAREASAILPRFGKKAKLLPLKLEGSYTLSNKVSYLDVTLDTNLCPRFTTALIKNTKVKSSPDYIKDRLIKIGLRPINNIVDVSNYIMHELGQPIHTFDYDKIKEKKMILRESRKGEKITTLDGKTFNLPGGDIVIEDGEGKLIDLCGIMGGQNSMVDENTKNVLLFVQTYNSQKVRNTSMGLAQRSEAAILFEKELDSENVLAVTKRAITLLEKITEGKAQKEILDLYPNPYKTKIVKTDLNFINKCLQTNLSKKDVSDTLLPLGFKTEWKNKTLTLKVPSFRAKDIDIAEDIVEEVARIYGYYKLDSKLMEGKLPEKLLNSPFDFEDKLKNILFGFGGTEIYTYSLVPKDHVDNNSLKLKNPLGKDTEYLRNSMLGSLKEAALQNLGHDKPFHLFEISNIYIPRKGNLPEEKMTLAGIFSNYDFNHAKGVVEALLEIAKVNYSFEAEEKKNFLPDHRLKIISKDKKIGEVGTLEEKDLIYYEFDMELLKKHANNISPFKSPSKYPPQIEDISLKVPERTKVIDIINSIKKTDPKLKRAELIDIYKDIYTFRLWYQSKEKTLTDDEVKKLREKIIKNISKKFGASVKS